jgi:hypothetical protein
MTTASQYRAYAQECIIDARNATSEPIREQFLALATLWLTAAARAENEEAQSSPGQRDGAEVKLDGASRPGSAGAE